MKHAILCLVALPAFADPPSVEAVRLDADRISVTLSHPDTGWEHYADGWRVENASGDVLAERPLAHPHVTEQPFTRSTRMTLLEGTSEVYIRARCNIDGWSKKVTRVAVGSP